MKEQIAQLDHALESALKQILTEQPDRLAMALASVNLLKNGMQQLKAIVLKGRFTCQAEEIRFFKYTKPAFLSRLLFHNFILQIEMQRPPGSEALARKMYSDELEKITGFFAHHRVFFAYYRTGCEYLDQKYFMRNKFDSSLVEGCCNFDADQRFTTSHDNLAATLLANQAMMQWLVKAMDADASAVVSTGDPQAGIPALKWTDSKASLVELAYGLHAKACINHGQIDIKTIIDVFQKMFQAELVDFYHVHHELRQRKTGQTKFFDAAREALIKRMDELEDRER